MPTSSTTEKRKTKVSVRSLRAPARAGQPSRRKAEPKIPAAIMSSIYISTAERETAPSKLPVTLTATRTTININTNSLMGLFPPPILELASRSLINRRIVYTCR